MAKILITGGAGFIGSNLAHACAARGDEVRVLDDLSSGRRRNLEGIGGRLEFIEGDIRDPEVVRRATRGADHVLHLAAMPSVARSVADPVSAHAVNIDGTLHVLEAARAEGVGRLIFAASAAAYGERPALPKAEHHLPQPLSPYAVGKLLGEYYCQVYHRSYGLQCVALRYFNVFGPRQSPDSDYAAVIPKFIERMSAGRAPVVFGDGLQSRDFVYIDDVVQANLKALCAPRAPGGVYNIACGERRSLLELIEALRGIFDGDLSPVFEEERPGDIRDSVADISAARRDLGYAPSVDFGVGLRRTAAWFTGEARLP